MPRAIWSGSISFGLVNVPVRMFSAIHESDAALPPGAPKDGGAIGYEKVCKKEGKPSRRTRSSRRYEISRGQVRLPRGRGLRGRRRRGLPHDRHPTSCRTSRSTRSTSSARTTSAREGAEKVYSLLLQAMEDAGLAAIATYVMRDRSTSAACASATGVITLEQMFFADEIRPSTRSSREGAGRQARARDGGRADRALHGRTSTRRSTRTLPRGADGRHQAQEKGKEVHASRGPRTGGAGDLLEALRASLESHRRNGRKAASGGNGSLSDLSKAELDQACPPSRHRGPLDDDEGRARRGARGGLEARCEIRARSWGRLRPSQVGSASVAQAGRLRKGRRSRHGAVPESASNGAPISSRASGRSRVPQIVSRAALSRAVGLRSTRA